jgi:hypothetical protein
MVDSEEMKTFLKSPSAAVAGKGEPHDRRGMSGGGHAADARQEGFGVGSRLEFRTGYSLFYGQ